MKMNRNFKYWLQLHVSKDYAKAIFHNMLRLFANRDVLFSSFSSSQALYTALRNMAKNNSDMYSFMPIKDPTDEQNDARPDTVKSSTLYNKMVCVNWYAKFLGLKYLQPSVFVKQIAWRSRNFQESKLILLLIDPYHTVMKFNRVIAKLQREQDYLDRFINNFYLARQEKDLQDFGENTLRPFLELSLRLLVRPLDTATVSSLKLFNGIMTHGDTPPIYNHPWMYYTSEFRIGIVYANRNRPVSFLLPGTLTLYFHFYIVYCRLRATTMQNQTLIFVQGKQASPWKFLVSNMRSYVQRLDLPPQEYGLIPGHSYVHDLAQLWAVIRTYKEASGNILNVDVLSKHLFVVGSSLAVSQATKYYRGLDKLRSLQEALVMMNFTLPTCSYPIGNLLPMGKKITITIVEELKTFVMA
jgi:hypothetical protein